MKSGDGVPSCSITLFHWSMSGGVEVKDGFSECVDPTNSIYSFCQNKKIAFTFAVIAENVYVGCRPEL